MGPIFVILVALLAAAIVNRLLGPDAVAGKGLRYLSAIGCAFLFAWLVGSALQDASFMMSPPGQYTLLAALVGGFVGAFGASVVARRRRVE